MYQLFPPHAKQEKRQKSAGTCEITGKCRGRVLHARGQMKAMTIERDAKIRARQVLQQRYSANIHMALARASPFGNGRERFFQHSFVCRLSCERVCVCVVLTKGSAQEFDGEEHERDE